LNSALDGNEWSASRPSRFTSGKTVLGTYWVEDWMLVLGAVEKKKALAFERNRTPAVQHIAHHYSN
jgi:hypothetical protein